MRPVLLEWGIFHIYSWGFMVGLGVLLGLFIVLRRAENVGINPEKISTLALYVTIAGIVGARIIYCITFWDLYRDRPWEVLWITGGGLTVYGSILFVVPTILWFARKEKIHLWKLLDLVVLGSWPAYALGRIGCYLNGCCYGLEYHGWLAYHAPHLLEPRFPTQLLSLAIAMLFFVVFVYYLYPRRKFDGQVFFYFIGAYALYRFGIEFLRDNPRPLWNLTIGQWAILLAVPFLWTWYRWHQKNASG